MKVEIVDLNGYLLSALKFEAEKTTNNLISNVLVTKKSLSVENADIDAIKVGLNSLSENLTANYATRGEIPTKITDLENDSNFITEHQSLAGYATETFVQQQITDMHLENHAMLSDIPEVPSLEGYVTENDLTAYASENSLSILQETLQNHANAISEIRQNVENLSAELSGNGSGGESGGNSGEEPGGGESEITYQTPGESGTIPAGGSGNTLVWTDEEGSHELGI